MIYRKLEKNIIQSLSEFPVVGIIGSRQVGKTTLSKMLSNGFPGALYLDLELPSDLNKLDDAEFFFREHQDQLIIIDEIQRKPELFPIIRAVVDLNRRNGKFLILGSASPALLKNSSESLAGRIIYHELPPFYLNEIKSEKITDLWERGGYPRSFLAEDEEQSFNWRMSFIKTYLETDIPQLGFRIPSVQLNRFWTMLAHNHGRLWNASDTARSIGVSPPSAKYYLDILTDTYIIRQLQPYFSNTQKRLIKSPKVYLRDSGILHSLLGIKTYTGLLGHPVAGFSWEGFVIEQIINNFARSKEFYFYRTVAGAELDLIMAEGGVPKFGFEVKLGLSPKLTKSFWNAVSDLNLTKVFVIYSGKDNYSINEQVEVVSLDHCLNTVK